MQHVLSVLPTKVQADIVLVQYFEFVDSVYPMIHRQTFWADYEQFWAEKSDEQSKTDPDPAFVTLIFAMLALGNQFVTNIPPVQRKESAEFYASACAQALRISSYLGPPSMFSVQAMVLLCYYLINDNKASYAWSFSGIIVHQAYAINLNREPNIGTCNAFGPAI